MPRIWTPVVALAACALAWSATPAAAWGPRPSCRAGHTVYHHGRTRLFYVKGTVDRSPVRTYWTCSRRLRRAVSFYESSPGMVFFSVTGFRPFGRRVGFDLVEADGVAEFDSIAWVDTTTGQWRSTYPDPTDLGFDSLGTYVIGVDGAVAMLLDRDPGSDFGPGQLIAYAGLGRKKLHSPKVIAQVPAADVVASSLAITGGAVTWTTKSGAHGSAPIPASAG